MIDEIQLSLLSAGARIVKLSAVCYIMTGPDPDPGLAVALAAAMEELGAVLGHPPLPAPPVAAEVAAAVIAVATAGRAAGARAHARARRPARYKCPIFFRYMNVVHL